MIRALLRASILTQGCRSLTIIPQKDKQRSTRNGTFTYFNGKGALATDRIPTLVQSKISGLTTALAAKVETRTKINGHALEGDIKLETTDIIAEVTELPEEGVIGEVVASGGKLYVWSGDK